MVVETKNFFFSLPIFFLFLISSISGVYSTSIVDDKNSCFNNLISQDSQLSSVSYDDYSTAMTKSDFYPHYAPWDGLRFYEEVVSLKFYKYGENSAYEHELEDTEIQKMGTIGWPSLSKYTFFEIYVQDPKLKNSQFAGCGVMYLEPKANYTYDTLLRKDFWGCPLEESFQDYKDLDEKWFFKTYTNNCYDNNYKPYSLIRYDRVLLDDPNLYINLYDISKIHGEFKERFYNGSDFSYFAEMYPKKLYNYAGDYKIYLRNNLLLLDYIYNDLENYNYVPVKDNIMFLNNPSIVTRMDNGLFEEDVLEDYEFRKKMFYTLKYEDFILFLDGITSIENNFDMFKYREEIVAKCESHTNVSCIGISLTNYLKEFSDNVHSVNFFVDTVLDYENSYYNFSSESKMDYVIENKKYIFDITDNIYEKEEIIEKTPNKPGKIISSISEKMDENKFYKFAIIIVSILIIFLCAITGFKFLNKKDE
ncbi:MAG: hypothetical protein KC589_01065 [Nanoarchaeota archaeon]|nr:hypothetical protein [Nanoarchaeota archaeon]